jgi:hypothetical protein
MNLKKLLKTTGVTIVVVITASLALTSEAAKAVEGFQSHEHPFQQIEPGKDQQEGNATCWQIFSNLGQRGTAEYQIGFPDSYIRGSLPVDKYAWDGTWINHANHIWYHQKRGICVANTHWYW